MEGVRLLLKSGEQDNAKVWKFEPSSEVILPAGSYCTSCEGIAGG